MNKMHVGEFEIEVVRVRRLLEEQFPEWAGLSLAPVASIGTDNALYRLGTDKVVRLPRIDWAVDTILKECEWLPKLEPFVSLAIPALMGKGHPSKGFPYPWAVYSWLEGHNPVVGQISDPDSLVQELVKFIHELHKVNLPKGPVSNRGVPLKEKDVETRKAIEKLDGMIDVQAVVAIWERALKVPTWSKLPVWVHGDLSPGNLLIHNHKLKAVIDFGICGRGDPACDMIVAWNLLPNTLRQDFRSLLDVDDATWDRGRGWALSNALIALPYYKDTNPALANNARHTIREILEE